MRRSLLNSKQAKITEKNFVFISYCWDDDRVKTRVKHLAEYLEKKGVSVLYDEGGLEPGAELSNFEYSILDAKCVCVLVVSDSNYVRKTEATNCGVAREFLYILKDYPKNTMKYIPLRVDATIPVFEGKVYIGFKDENHFDEILSIVKSRIAEDRDNTESVKMSKHVKGIYDSEFLIAEAINLYDKNDYSAALKKINKLIKKHSDIEETSKDFWAKVYNVKLICMIKSESEDEILQVIESLLDSIDKKMDNYRKIIYYGNCSLGYRLIKNEDKFEEYAKMAYSYAQKTKSSDISYYESLYSLALYETDQMTDAYKYAKKAVEHIQARGSADSVSYIKYKANLAEVAIYYSKLKTRVSERVKLLKEALETIKDVIALVEKGAYDDVIISEVYGLAARIYTKASEYYRIER